MGNGLSNSFKSENDIFLLSILLESKRNGGKYKLGSVYDLDAKGKHKLESVIQAEKDLGEVEVKEKLTHKLEIEDNVKNVGSLESEIKYKGIKDIEIKAAIDYEAEIVEENSKDKEKELIRLSKYKVELNFKYDNNNLSILNENVNNINPFVLDKIEGKGKLNIEYSW